MEYVIAFLPALIVFIISAFILMYQQIGFLKKDITSLEEKVFKQHLDVIDFKYKAQSLEWHIDFLRRNQKKDGEKP
jgi:hypothetical protein